MTRLGLRLVTAAEEAREIARNATWVTEEAIALKREAHAGPVGKRHSSFELYAVLGRCMALAQHCAMDPEAEDELRRLVREEPSSGKGRWVFKDSDTYLLVCRFVFPRRGSSRGQLSNASRYASALRMAAMQQIVPQKLSQHLRENGGINALFLSRSVDKTTFEGKTIHLDRRITVPKGGTVTLTIRHKSGTTFEIVDD